MPLRCSFLYYSQARGSSFEFFYCHWHGWLINNLRINNMSYNSRVPDLEPIISTAYICQMGMSYWEGRLLFQAHIGYLPLPAVWERQSVLCVLVGSSSPWLSSLTAKCWLTQWSWLSEASSLGSSPSGLTPVAHRTLTASVSHVFLLLAKPSGSLLWPSNLPFHLGSHTRSRQGDLLLFPASEASLSSLSTPMVPVSYPVIRVWGCLLHQNV